MSDADEAKQDQIERLLREAQEAANASASSSAQASNAEDSNSATAERASAAAAEQSADSVATAAADTSASSARRGTHDDINTLLHQAEEALASIDRPTAADLEGIAPFQFQDFTSEPPSKDKATLELLRDVELDLRIELGRAHMQLEDILKLRKGSVVPLDKLAGDPVDVYVNGRLVARGEVLVLNDNFCVRVAQLLAGEEAA